MRAFETNSSNLWINNGGTGPALRVTQVENGPLGAQPVAEFYNGAGTAALVIDNAGNLAVNKPTAGFELDVSGVVCAVGLSGCITDSTSMTSSIVAASATAFKSAYALANAAVPSSGGYVSGTLAVGKTSVLGGIACDVSGIVRASAFQLVSGGAIGGGGGGGGYCDISGTGIWAGSNVGVGRSPTGTYALDVSGNANVSGSVNATSITTTVLQGIKATFNLTGSGSSATATSVYTFSASGLYLVSSFCTNLGGTPISWYGISLISFDGGITSTTLASNNFVYVNSGTVLKAYLPGGGGTGTFTASILKIF